LRIVSLEMPAPRRRFWNFVEARMRVQTGYGMTTRRLLVDSPLASRRSIASCTSWPASNVARLAVV